MGINVPIGGRGRGGGGGVEGVGGEWWGYRGSCHSNVG